MIFSSVSPIKLLTQTFKIYLVSRQKIFSNKSINLVHVQLDVIGGVSKLYGVVVLDGEFDNGRVVPDPLLSQGISVFCIKDSPEKRKIRLEFLGKSWVNPEIIPYM